LPTPGILGAENAMKISAWGRGRATKILGYLLCDLSAVKT